MKKILLLLLITLSVNANNFVYMTEEAEHSDEYGYIVTLKTKGEFNVFKDSGHAWIKFQSFKEPSKNTSLGFYTLDGKISNALYSKRGEIKKEYGGENDSLRINVTKREFDNALLVANYFKGTCSEKGRNGCTVWRTKNSYSLIPYNSFACTHYAHAILKATGMPVPIMNYTAPKWYLYNIVRSLGIN